MPIVLDTSVSMAWCFEDEASPLAERALDYLATGEAVVPSLWQLEVANVLLVAERRGRLTEAQAARFVGLLGQLPISIDPSTTDIEAVVATGRLHALSAHDAAYLLLAQRSGFSIATLDDDLAAAATRAGVALFGV